MKSSRFFPLISAFFVTTLVVSNIIAVKIGNFGTVGAFDLFLPVAVVVFPVSYIIGDVLTEVYGYSATRRTIWIGFLCNLFAVAAIWIGMRIPSAPFFDGQASYQAILGPSARILLASFLAYLVGGFANAYVMAKMKVASKGKNLFSRVVSSTVVGEGLDSFIFAFVAFYGIFETYEVAVLAMTHWIFKTMFEVVATPITYFVVGYLKKVEKLDTFDKKTAFNPFSF